MTYESTINQAAVDRYGNLNKKYQRNDDYSWDPVSEEDKPELAEALSIIEAAAERGHATPQAILGSAYEFAQGVEKDVEKAVKWNTLAAEQVKSCISTTSRSHAHIRYHAIHRAIRRPSSPWGTPTATALV